MITTGTLSALDVWAAARHHSDGGAEGHPPYDEIFQEPAPPAAAQEPADSSEQTYDATKGKYDKPLAPAIDHRILASIEAVERAFRKHRAPEWLRRYLLFKHPRYGRYAPETVGLAPEDDARAFVDGGHMCWMLGGISSLYIANSLVRTVHATEREFISRLARELANQPDPAVLGQYARSDSQARRGTA